MTEPSLKFAGRFAFQSVKLILRVAFILIKVVLAVSGVWAAFAWKLASQGNSTVQEEYYFDPSGKPYLVPQSSPYLDAGEGY